MLLVFIFLWGGAASLCFFTCNSQIRSQDVPDLVTVRFTMAKVFLLPYFYGKSLLLTMAKVKYQD